jgi:hypothetical protein
MLVLCLNEKEDQAVSGEVAAPVSRMPADLVGRACF